MIKNRGPKLLGIEGPSRKEEEEKEGQGGYHPHLPVYD